MNVGDLIKIASIKKEIVGLVIETPNDYNCNWACIMDFCGNIIWWPPNEIITLSSTVEIFQQGEKSDRSKL